jgi:ribosomal protein L13
MENNRTIWLSVTKFTQSVIGRLSSETARIIHEAAAPGDDQGQSTVILLAKVSP